MADNTSRMIALLGAMRKQMNGAVADAMRYYGKKYGLNYGVSLPTLRSIAGEEEQDYSLAQYLYKQQVRELRLAALHIAQAEALTIDEAPFWAEGVINSEVAEEMAFTLLGKAADAKLIITEWSRSEDEFLAYAALMAAARHSANIDQELITESATIAERFSASRIIAQGVVAMLTAAHSNNIERESITVMANKIKESATAQSEGFATAQYIAEELEWRLEM